MLIRFSLWFARRGLPFTSNKLAFLQFIFVLGFLVFIIGTSVLSLVYELVYLYSIENGSLSFKLMESYVEKKNE